MAGSKKSRVFQIAVKGGSKFCLSLGELETLLGGVTKSENLRRRRSGFD